MCCELRVLCSVLCVVYFSESYNNIRAFQDGFLDTRELSMLNSTHADVNSYPNVRTQGT